MSVFCSGLVVLWSAPLHLRNSEDDDSKKRFQSWTDFRFGGFLTLNHVVRIYISLFWKANKKSKFIYYSFFALCPLHAHINVKNVADSKMIIRDKTFKGWRSKSDSNDLAAETSSSLFHLRVISPVCSSPLSSGLHGDFCYIGGSSQKSEHFKSYREQSLQSPPPPFRMHDIQSVGHTWLLSDKTLSSSNSCSRIVASVGGQEDTSDAFSNPFSAPQYWVSFWQGGHREICSLCSGSDTDGARFLEPKNLPQGFDTRDVFSQWGVCDPLSFNLPHFNLIHTAISHIFLQLFLPSLWLLLRWFASPSGQSGEKLVVHIMRPFLNRRSDHYSSE